MRRPPRQLRSIAAALAVTLHAGASTVGAQSLGGPPSAENCVRWGSALAAGRDSALGALNMGWFGGCRDVGPRALAAALERAGSETDTTYLSALSARAGTLTHPAILSAALRLASDRAASVEARAAGLLVLSGEFGHGMDINGRAGGTLLTVALPEPGACFVGLRVVSPDPPATAALPSDAPRQAAVVVDRIRTDASEPTLLRTLARCVRPAVARGVPPQVDVSGVRLNYACGDWFRIHNPTGEPLTFTFAAEKTGERHNIIVPPGGERQFAIAAPSTVRLYFDGRLIQTTTHGGTTCPTRQE